MIMRNSSRPVRLLASAVLLLLGACFKLSREAPREQLYALSGASGVSAAGGTTSSATSATPATARAGLVIGLRRLDLASYLSEREIVVRRGENRLQVSEFHRWGGDLDEGINRALASYLVLSPPVRAADVAPWAAGERHDFLVQLHVSRFEGVADSTASEGRAHVLARWDIIRPLDGRVLLRGTSEDRSGPFRVGDYAGLVTALDAALARVARDISACLSRFPNDSTPPASCTSASGVGSR
jgi:uncharacterized protein